MNFRPLIAKKIATLLLICASLVQPVQAQEFPSEPNWTITAYLWTMSIDGTVGIGPITADIDLSFSDLLSDLNYGGAIAFRRDWGRNVFVADLNYYSLSPDDVTTPLGGKISTDLAMPLYAFYYGRKTALGNGTVAWLIGARYLELDLKLTQTPALPMAGKNVRKASPGFTDFLIGGSYQKPIGEKWDMNLQGDFGVGGSDQSWQAQIFFSRTFQSGNALILGAWVTDVDFEDKLPNGEFFKYDAITPGLTIGYSWR
jgi:hypothetical protein